MNAFAPFVEIVDGLLGLRLEPRHELFVEFLGLHVQFFFDYFGRGELVAEVAEHGDQLIVAPFLRDVAADLAALEIGHGDLFAVSGVHEAAV
jgi:hypothetical protein